MIIGLKAVPVTNVSEDFIAENLFDVISKLCKIGFNVRCAVCDDHSGNVRADSQLGKHYGEVVGLVHLSSVL